MAITNWIYKSTKEHTLHVHDTISGADPYLFIASHTALPYIVYLPAWESHSASGCPCVIFYYCQQKKEVQTYGEDRAMGIYNFTDNVADSAGNSIFGLISRTGLLPGTLILTGISMAFISIHALLTSSKFSRKRKEE